MHVTPLQTMGVLPYRTEMAAPNHEPVEQTPWHEREGFRRALKCVGAAAVVGACHVGGVMMTNAVPATAETANFKAEITVPLNPLDNSSLEASTSLGSIMVHFDAPLPPPGIKAQIEIKSSILNSLGTMSSAESGIIPDNNEVGDALEQAATGLAWRYGAGVLAVDALLGAGMLMGKGRLSRRTLLHGLLAATSVLGYSGASAYTGYNPDNFTAYSTTGIINQAAGMPRVFSDLQSRSEAAGPYVKGWLTTEKVLREKFVPFKQRTGDGLKFMVLGDVHGQNNYSVVKEVIESEKVSAVVDFGDLLNFGSVEEAEAAGIFDAIANLGVPYIFYLGNHDTNNPKSTALLDRLSQIDNVYLVQPDDDTYNIVNVGGVTWAGFNDDRYFGDDNQDNDSVEQASAEVFNDALGSVPYIDFVGTHEPAGADAITVANKLVFNGHTHTAAIDGKHITVGTFTGGGYVYHYVPDIRSRFQSDAAAQQDAEPRGQDQSYYLLTVGEDCTPTTLTSFVYNGILEGKPAFKTITVTNAEALADDVPEADNRICSSALPTTVTAVRKLGAPTEPRNPIQ